MNHKWSGRQVKALKASINHWQRMADGNTDDRPGTEECSCCKTYWDNDCKACPIFLYTGHLNCIGTPYDSAIEEFGNYNHSKKFRELAKVEVDFLRKVLESGHERI